MAHIFLAASCFVRDRGVDDLLEQDEVYERIFFWLLEDYFYSLSDVLNKNI